MCQDNGRCIYGVSYTCFINRQGRNNGTTNRRCKFPVAHILSPTATPRQIQKAIAPASPFKPAITLSRQPKNMQSGAKMER